MTWKKEAQQTLTAICKSDFVESISRHGTTDLGYLAGHFPRFQGIARQWLSHWQGPARPEVLDVGGHWLHMAALLSDLGCQVTACDLPHTFELDSVQALAGAKNIGLITYTGSLPCQAGKRDRLAVTGRFASCRKQSGR